MLMTLRTKLFVLIGLLSLTAALAQAHAESSWRAAVYSELAPHSYIDSAGQHSGILIEFLQLLESQQGVDIDYRVRPHGRIISELVAGQVDIALLLVMPDELDIPADDAVVVTPGAILSAPFNIYFNANRTTSINYPEQFSTLADLTHLRVGFLRAGASEAHLSLHQKQGMVYFNSNESMVKSLLANRIDLIGMDQFSVSYWNKTLPANLKMKYPLVNAYVHLAFSRKTLGDKVDQICTGYWQYLVKLRQEQALLPFFTDYSYPGLEDRLVFPDVKEDQCVSLKRVLSNHPHSAH